MAKKSVLVVECDKCHRSNSDVTLFRHLVVSTIPPLDDKKAKAEVVVGKDLCLDCLGMPGVNVA
jgi:hypothetical protein